MPNHPRILIAVADGEHARFLRPAADHALQCDTALDSALAHKRSAELGSDHPGASFHSTSTARHALEPRHDPHSLEKQKFARLIAAQLNQAEADGAFDELVVVAPAHTLNTIREELNHATVARLVGTLAKDLVKTPDHELGSHLLPWVRPVERAAR